MDNGKREGKPIRYLPRNITLLVASSRTCNM